MAHLPLTVSAIAAFMMLSASPIASATHLDEQVAANQVPAEQETTVNPAQQANMISMNMCGERDQVVEELSQVFKETPMALGQVDSNAVVEIFVSESGTWTILATGTDGVSCIVSAGEGFESTTLVRGVDA